MIIIVSECIVSKLKGKLRLYLFEIRPGVYIGNVSKKTREILWGYVKAFYKKGSVLMMWNTNSELGFEFISLGEDKYKSIEIDGLNFISFKQV
jgi:CRISPR-associated protein Cas2